MVRAIPLIGTVQFDGKKLLDYKRATYRSDPKYSGRKKTETDLSISLPTKISGTFGKVESTLAL